MRPRRHPAMRSFVGRIRRSRRHPAMCAFIGWIRRLRRHPALMIQKSPFQIRPLFMSARSGILWRQPGDSHGESICASAAR
ncbi:hypothetical protein HMPREF0208_04295 [Citrobacter koseri]|nr:hypothetical protein HMPREF0208_04295 [Citrobacter koseri]